MTTINMRTCICCKRQTRASQVSCTYCGVWDKAGCVNEPPKPEPVAADVSAEREADDEWPTEKDVLASTIYQAGEIVGYTQAETIADAMIAAGWRRGGDGAYRRGQEAMKARCIHACAAAVAPIKGTPYSAGGRSFCAAIEALPIEGKDELRAAATDVLKRWDSTDWKAAPTADVMNRLRYALRGKP